MGNGIGGVQGGVGHVDLGQTPEPVNKRGLTASEDRAELQGILDSTGIAGNQPEKPKKVKVGTAEDAPRLDRARGKSDLEKFFSTVGKGIKSVFSSVADKIAKLFEPKPHYNLNLGNTPPAQLTREAFVPLPFVAAEGEAVPKSVSALTELQKQVGDMVAQADGKPDAASRAGVFGTLFRGGEPGVNANNAFVASHLDFRSIAEDVISSCADQIMSAAKTYEAFIEASNEDSTAPIYGMLQPQGTPKADAKAEEARGALAVAVFETADRLLEALFDAGGLFADQPEDLKAFTMAKMDVIASADAPLEEKAVMARNMLANDFILRGFAPNVGHVRNGMDEAPAQIIKHAMIAVQSILNGAETTKGANEYEPAKELFNTLRDKHQGEPMDTFFQALGMPAEYRKDA